MKIPPKEQADLITAVADQMRTSHGYISYEPETLEKFVKNHCASNAQVASVTDYFQDFCLAQGCEVQE
jgi:hypothetical protein